MKVELSIKDDSELRNLIKDMIKGQVNSLVRDELREMAKKSLTTEVEKKIKEVTQYEIKTILRTVANEREIRQLVREAVATHITEEIEDRIFTKSLELLGRDNKAIEELVDKKLKNIRFAIGA